VLNQINKSVQLFETFKVRFGVMIVGSSNSGKTSITDLLALSLTSLHKKSTTRNPDFIKIERHILNPKSISMG
jgi:dynein heavy chain, axonemal